MPIRISLDNFLSLDAPNQTVTQTPNFSAGLFVNETSDAFAATDGQITITSSLPLNTSNTDGKNMLTFKNTNLNLGHTYLLEADTFGAMMWDSTEGALEFWGSGSAGHGLALTGIYAVDNTVKTTAALGAVSVAGAIVDTDSINVMGNNANNLVLKDYTTAKFIFSKLNSTTGELTIPNNGVISSPGVIYINIDAANASTTQTFQVRNNGYGTSGSTLFKVNEQGSAEAVSFTIGANTLNTTEWAFLDGQDQAVKTTSSPAFVAVTTPTIAATGDLTLDPAGLDVLVDGGLTVGSTTQAGDNNLRVEGTSTLVGNVITSTKNIAGKSYFNGDSTDFVQPSATLSSPWSPAANNSGTSAVSNSNANNIGIHRFTSSTIANSGYRYITSLSTFLLAGTETSVFVFFLPATDASTTIRLGFQDSATSTAPVDGVWINIANTTLDGRTSSNSTSSTTGTSYTLSASTWYSVKIVLNSAATQADFYLYDSSGTQLWTDNLTTNIPTASGRVTGHGLVANNSGTTAVDLLDIDYMDVSISRQLTR